MSLSVPSRANPICERDVWGVAVRSEVESENSSPRFNYLPERLVTRGALEARLDSAFVLTSALHVPILALMETSLCLIADLPGASKHLRLRVPVSDSASLHGHVEELVSKSRHRSGVTVWSGRKVLCVCQCRKQTSKIPNLSDNGTRGLADGSEHSIARSSESVAA